MTIVAEPHQARQREELSAVVKIIRPAAPWKRMLFNGLAQVIVQSTGEPGEIILKAVSGNLNGELKLSAQPAKARAGVE